MRFRVAAAALAMGALLVSSSPAHAGAGEGLALAKRHQCGAAVPILESSEQTKHTLLTASALAACYVEVGELIKASDLYHAIAEENPPRVKTTGDTWTRTLARKRAADLDARISTVAFTTAEPVEGLEVELDGHSLGDPTQPTRALPSIPIHVVARAKGRKEWDRSFKLNEGEHKIIPIALESEGHGEAAPIVEPPPSTPVATPETRPPKAWIGVRFQSFLIPTVAWRILGDGGTTVFAPGGGLTLTLPSKRTDVVFFLGYASYQFGDTPFKPRGAPDTDYEILDSTLKSLYGAVSLMWKFPLDSGNKWSFRAGGGIGVGWMFGGNLYRTQAYPRPGDSNPYDYIKCKGPNNPVGSFLYCNQLDKDANHYHNFAEPDWFHHGIRPAIYPFLMLPELALSYQPSPRVAIDLEAGLSLTGILLSLGVRYGL